MILLLAVAFLAVFGLFFVSWVWRNARERDLRADRGVAEAWLQCIDCAGPFLERLASVPPQRQDPLVTMLATALLGGPDSVRRARHERDLVRVWRADSAYLAGLGDTMRVTRDSFTARYRGGFEVMWRSRAATALGIIRGPKALAALDSAEHQGAGIIVRGDSTILIRVRRARADSTPAQAMRP
jgi:hypothetical protein